MIYQQSIQLKTQGRGTINITSLLENLCEKSGISNGICNVFIRHTSASLILCENADPDVRSDLEAFLNKLVPDGAAVYQHNTEGPDDMAAHIRSILTDCSLTLPLCKGRFVLGEWQGIYLYEHRYEPHNRSVFVTIYGD